MMKREHGLSGIKIVLVVSLLLVTVAAGWFNYQSSRRVQNTRSNNSVANPASKVADKNKLSIGEWNVSGPIHQSITYKLSADKNSIRLASAEVASNYPSCKSDDNVGVLSRLSAGAMFGTVPQPIESYSPDVVTKVGTYYYVYQDAPSFCGAKDPSSAAAETKYLATVNDLRSFRAHLSAISR